MDNPIVSLCIGIFVLYIVWLVAFLSLYAIGRAFDTENAKEKEHEREKRSIDGLP